MREHPAGGVPRQGSVEKESSFSGEKEAKRLYPLAPRLIIKTGPNRIKVFWFFFSKKNFFLTSV